MQFNLVALAESIDILESAVAITPIERGYSFDKKYKVQTRGGDSLLLRIMSIDQLQSKQVEYEVIGYLFESGVKVAKPLYFGKSDSQGICYYVLSYIEGEDANTTLPTYSTDVQFHIGEAAGRDLRQIHNAPVKSDIGPWSDRCLKKFRAYLESYKTSGIRMNHADRVIEFVEGHQTYLKDRPNQFQHDDFHVGNIIVRDGRYVGAIDFNRYDWGDPFHDMVKTGFFSTEVSVPFSVGQVQGYFQGEVPSHFWTLYSVYVGMMLFSSVVWTQRVAPHELGQMLDRVHRVIDDHRGFESMVPNWYRE